MPEHRTKKQKIAAQLRQEANLLYSYQANQTVNASKGKSRSNPDIVAQSIFRYDTHLIVADLRKTLIITCMMVLMLVLLSLKLR